MHNFRFCSILTVQCISLCPLGAPVGGSGITQVFVRCSDTNVVTDCKPTQPGEPHDVFIKVCTHTAFLLLAINHQWHKSK